VQRSRLGKGGAGRRGTVSKAAPCSAWPKVCAKTTHTIDHRDFDLALAVSDSHDYADGGASMIPSYYVYPFAGLFIAIGCFVVVVGVRMCREARVTWTWPSTEGVVRDTEVVETFCAQNSNKVFQPVVKYEYLVNERRHTGKRIKIVDIASGSKYAHRVVASYPVGAKITVYYNPNSPEEAVLRRGNDGNTIGIPFLGLFFVLVGAGICLGYHMFQNNGH
jgi:hypothetical protein